MQRLQEKLKLAISRSYSATQVADGADVDMARVEVDKHRRALFMVILSGEIEQGNSDSYVRLNVNQSVGLSGPTAVLKEDIDIFGGVNASKAKIDTDGHGAGEIVTINGVEFTRVTSGASGNEWVNRDGLISVINDADIGINAGSDGSHVVELEVDFPGTKTIDVSATGAAIDCFTTEAVALVEVHNSELDEDKHVVWVNVENESNANLYPYAVVVLGDPYNLPVDQQVALQE